MMMYTVLHPFYDLQDGNHVYLAGDAFPRKGLQVSEERIAELSGSENKRGIPLIAAAEPEQPKKRKSK